MARVTGLILLFLISSAHAFGEVWKMEGFFRADTSAGIFLEGTPFLAQTKTKNRFPGSDAFIPVNNDSLYDLVHTRHPVTSWFRIQVRYNGTTPDTFALRSLGYEEVGIFQVRDVNEIPVAKAPKIKDTFYNCGYVVLQPGVNTLFFSSENGWYKFGFSHIDLLRVAELEDDRAVFYQVNMSFIVFFVAFLFMLCFQLIYIIIQWIYHQRREYIEYSMYLICLVLYFGIRCLVILRFEETKAFTSFVEPHLSILMLVLPYVFYFRFSRYFIGMPERFPSMNKQLKIAERILLGLCVVIGVIHYFEEYKISSEFSLLIVVVLFIYTVWLIRFFYFKRDQIIRFMLAASLFAASGHLLAMSFSVIPALREWISFGPIYFTMIGITFELFLFNTGLGYKAKYDQEEKLKAQRDLINQLAENKRIQEEMHEMRNRIAGDLHDDVGSTLSSIGLYSEVAAKQIDTDPAAIKGILVKIADSTRRMMEAMSDIVWAIHSREDEAGGLTTRMQHAANERLAHTDIKFILEKDKEVGHITLTIEARRNLLMLFKEAVNNAAKYSEAKTFTCSLSVSHGIMEMKLTDDGKGVDPAAPVHGNGRLTMSNRIKDLGGTFEWSSVPGQGTEIIIRVPLSSISLTNYIPFT
jgi:signal transduction histidine kinase